MNDGRKRETLLVKKYPNRRFYDASNSRHITLQELHDAILAGKDVSVTDSRSGEDITNLVLFQILLEKDPPKLDIFPSSILLLMIRSNLQVIRTTMERLFSPFWSMMASSQKQFDEVLKQAMNQDVMTPFDWAGRFYEAFTPGVKPTGPEDLEVPVEGPSSDTGEVEVPDVAEEAMPGGGDAREASLEELRRNLADLARRVEAMDATAQGTSKPSGGQKKSR